MLVHLYVDLRMSLVLEALRRRRIFLQDVTVFYLFIWIRIHVVYGFFPDNVVHSCRLHYGLPRVKWSILAWCQFKPLAERNMGTQTTTDTQELGRLVSTLCRQVSAVSIVCSLWCFDIKRKFTSCKYFFY